MVVVVIGWCGKWRRWTLRICIIYILCDGGERCGLWRGNWDVGMLGMCAMMLVGNKMDLET